MCAVWGGTYILRRGIRHLVVDCKANSRTDITTNEIDNNNNNNNNSSLSTHTIEDTTGRIFTCNNFVCNVEDLKIISDIDSFSITLTAICDCNVLPESRTLLVIPPNVDTINNSNAIYVIQSDSDTFVTPQGYSILHILMKENLNENITSRNEWNKFSNSSNCIQYSINIKNVIKLLQSMYKFELLSYSTVIRPIFVSHSSNESNSFPLRPSSLENLPSSIGICGDTSIEIHIDNSVKQAKDIFNKLFPTDLFFPIPDLEEGVDEDDKQEADYLNSTLNDYSQSSTIIQNKGNNKDNNNKDDENSPKEIDIFIE